MHILNYLLLGLALVHIALLAWTFTLSELQSWRGWFLRGLLFGMAWDNSIVALGNILAGAPVYHALSTMRFLLHASVLPLLTLFTLSVMGRAGIALAGNGLFRGFCVVFTAVALIYGIYHEVLLLELAPVDNLGVYKLSSSSGVPPFATIFTNLFILPLTAWVWRKSGWPWFFLATLFIFLVNGATGAQPWGFICGNLAELVFICALVFTERHFSRAHMVVTK